MRVGLDVSPLEQTAAGTARYIDALGGIDGVEQRPSDRHRRVFAEQRPDV